ncbi:MAG: hypothetical protein PVG92_08510 [Holophagae bacterium]|jgi:hypothetical protein
MSKKRRQKKKRIAANGPTQQRAPQKNTKYSAGEIAMAVLGAALLVMFGVIIVTSILGTG